MYYARSDMQQAIIIYLPCNYLNNMKFATGRLYCILQNAESPSVNWSSDKIKEYSSSTFLTENQIVLGTYTKTVLEIMYNHAIF